MLPSQDLDHIIDHTEYLWREFAGSRIYITGGTGFIGKWLLESLMWANQRLNVGISATVLSRKPDIFIATYPHLAKNNALHILKGDVRQAHDLNNHDAVIHAAGDSDDQKNNDDPLAMLDTIVKGSRSILDALATARSKNALFLSSGAIYGEQPVGLTHVGEDCLLAPRTDYPTAKTVYAEAKRVAEIMACHFADRHSVPVSIARCFSFLGPYLPLDRHFAAGNFMRDALHNKNIVIQGDGTTIRSYMHPADLSIWLWTILFRGQPGRYYNVGSDIAVSTKELAQRIAKSTGNSLPVEVLGKSTGNKVDRYIPNISRAKNELGLDLHICLDEAISRTVDWAKVEASKK